MSRALQPRARVDTFILDRPGDYFFVVSPGTYEIAAFVDRSRDFTYAPEQDPAAYYGAPTPVQVAAGQKVGGLDLHTPSEPGVRLDFPICATSDGGVHAASRPSR